MKIKISGSTGYLGTLISKNLEANKHTVEGIQRELLYGPVADLQEFLKDADVVINLAGAPILTRWTEKNKKIIYGSRVKTTKNLVDAINHLNGENQPKKFISASAIGIYENGKTHSENSKDFNSEFMGKLVLDWEKASDNLTPAVQKIIFRMAPVIGKEAEMIKKMKLPFKSGVGGKIGEGDQPFPFVHEKDVADAYLWAVEGYNRNGLFNLVAPENINNKEFTSALAKTLHRPAIFKIPGFALKLVYGEAAETLLESPEVKPLRLLEAGFRFKYPDIHSALSDILH